MLSIPEELKELVLNNAVLYYSDYIKLKEESRTVSDNCKYYFMYGAPINATYLSDCAPFYDKTDKYYIESAEQCRQILDKFGLEGLLSFVRDICNLNALGVVNAKQMLACIHYYEGKHESRRALKQYENWLDKQYYTHLEDNGKGEMHRVECTRYVAHAELGTQTLP